MPGTELRGTVRRDPRAEAQFEMDKAAPMLAAFEGVTKFAAARWQASQEAQFNEAALAIEEGMRDLLSAGVQYPKIVEYVLDFYQ